MTFLRRAYLLLTATGLMLGVGTGCSAVLNPSDDVDKCDNVDDCDAPDDNRFDAQCIKEDNDIPGVCVAILKEDVGCDPDNPIFMEKPFKLTYDEWATAGRYNDGCDLPENAGAQGCPGPCKSGLSVNGDGVCDDNDSNTPRAVPAKVEFVGQDVVDQHCRSYFCDQDFVCDRSNPNKPICKPCSADDSFGFGGCGNLYMNGAPSCIYQTKAELEGGASCKAPDSDPQATVFGTCM